MVTHGRFKIQIKERRGEGGVMKIGNETASKGKGEGHVFEGACLPTNARRVGTRDETRGVSKRAATCILPTKSSLYVIQKSALVALAAPLMCFPSKKVPRST